MSHWGGYICSIAFSVHLQREPGIPNRTTHAEALCRSALLQHLTQPSALSRAASIPSSTSTIVAVTVMSDSDGEYVADDLSDEDIAAHQVSKHGTRSAGPVRGAAGSATRGGDTNTGTNRRRAAWEDIQRSWDTVVEGADGSINSTVEGLREAGKRKRYEGHCLDSARF
jgi:hypothetical protein